MYVEVVLVLLTMKFLGRECMWEDQWQMQRKIKAIKEKKVLEEFIDALKGLTLNPDDWKKKGISKWWELMKSIKVQ